MPYPYPEVSTWEEMSGSPVEKWSYFAFQSTVTLLCPWDERTLLAASIMSGGGEFYPRIPQSTARARNVDIVPFDAQVTGVSGAIATKYEKAQITITYDSNCPDGDLIQESMEPSCDMLQLGIIGFAWGKWIPREPDFDPTFSEIGEAHWIKESPLLEEEGPAKVVPMFDWKLTIHKVIQVPDMMDEIVGKVNDRDIISPTLKQIFKKGTLLFNPPTASRTLTVDTNMTWQKTWELSYRFTHRVTGWNYYWRRATRKWHQIVYDHFAPGDNDPNVMVFTGVKEYKSYEEVDFSPLLPWITPQNA